MIRYYLFFGIVYFLQGIWGIHSQPLYYLMRETWKLSATTIGLIGMITTIPWVIKPLYGLICDFFPLKGFKAKYWITLNYSILIFISLLVWIFGLNFWTLIITGFIVAYCFAFNDVANDSVMCIIEKRHNLQGKVQSLQWTAIGIAGLITSLGGAYISKYFDYRLAYLVGVFPIILGLIFIAKLYKGEIAKSKKVNLTNIKKSFLVFWKNKQLLLSLIFLFCFYLSPSFGTPLMIKMRETLHIDKMFIGLLGTVGTTFGIIGYILYFFKIYKFNLKKLLYFAVLFSGLTTFCYLYIPNQWTLLVYNILFGTIGAIIHLTILSYCAKITPKGNEGFTFAGIMSVLNFGSMLSGYLGAFLYDKIGYNNLVIISALFTIVCVFFIPKLDIVKNKC